MLPIVIGLIAQVLPQTIGEQTQVDANITGPQTQVDPIVMGEITQVEPQVVAPLRVVVAHTFLLTQIELSNSKTFILYIYMSLLCTYKYQKK